VHGRSAVVFVRAADGQAAREHVCEVMAPLLLAATHLRGVVLQVRLPDEPAVARAVAAASGHGRLMTLQDRGSRRLEPSVWQQPGESPPEHEGELI
jgi:hypothetical protein